MANKYMEKHSTFLATKEMKRRMVEGGEFKYDIFDIL
jgi:hypothetical protein